MRSDLQKLKFFSQPISLTEILHQDENKKHNLSIVLWLNTNGHILMTSQPVFTCSKLIIETLEEGVKYVQLCHWRRSSIFIVNFEHISHLVLVFLLLTLNM